jgi:2-dehydro-3-deoxygluconokinase
MIADPRGKKCVVAFGELMLRLVPEHGQRFRQTNTFVNYFGGAEANTCALLGQLGVEARFVSALPWNELGQAAVDALHRYSVSTQFVSRNDQRMGIYFTENGNGIRPSRVIYDRKNSAFSFLKKADIHWDQALKGADLFYWSGISPALTQQTSDLCKEALDTAKTMGVQIAADMNYRSTLWDYGKKPADIMPELLSYCDIITGDVDTIDVYFGIKTDKHLTPEDQFRHCATALQQRLPSMKVFAMSFRGITQHQQHIYRGALMVEDGFHFSPAFQLPQVTDRIGSGDAFQAGLLYGLLQQLPAEKTINYATACGVLKHSMAGDVALLHHHEIEHFMEHGPVNHVIR